MAKVKKNKMKTHKGTKKVLNVRKSGSIAITHQGVLHNTGKRTSKTNRQKRNQSELHKSDYKRIKDLI
ncbi:MAG: 50S ribosomal protein L35 [Bacilli bacterium]|nr:50S ribosomal protein L35 [Bacilli bacterium]